MVFIREGLDRLQSEHSGPVRHDNKIKGNHRSRHPVQETRSGPRVARANLVSNGSFETFTGVFGGDGGAQLTPVSTTLTDWTVLGDEIAVLKSPNGYLLTAADGVNFLDLAGYTNTSFPTLTRSLHAASILGLIMLTWNQERRAAFRNPRRSACLESA